MYTTTANEEHVVLRNLYVSPYKRNFRRIPVRVSHTIFLTICQIFTQFLHQMGAVKGTALIFVNVFCLFLM